MKKKISIVLLLVFAVFAFAGCGGQDAKQEVKPLVVGMELAYPPFETKDAQGNATGISVDFSKDFGAYIGREVVIENISWDGLIPALQTGKVDMVISSMTITADREEVVDFSDPYANAMLALLTNKNSGINTIDDMNVAGKKIAVKTGSTGYLYAQKNLTNAEVYKRALISKQLFSKIKLNPNYHPDKKTAMRLCIGAKLNLDETKDLLARAGYALSPCDKRDIIFSYFIEHGVYDMVEIDIALEEHDLPCFIS